MNERYDIFNIRQRGIGNPNPVKLGRCIKELERIYGVREGSANQKGNNRIGEPKVSDDQLTQSDIAEIIGISVDTLNNYKKLTELILELEDLVNTGIVTTHTALGYETKDEVMQWMLDIQLGRRNLSPIQRIAVAEKYRPIYERQARENISKAVSESNKNRTNPTLPKLVNMEQKSVDTTKKLAQVAGVGKETYRMGAKGLNSDNQKLKNEVLSGEKTISKAYKELHNENKKVAVEYVKLCGYKNGKILFVMNKNMFDVEGINIIFCG